MSNITKTLKLLFLYSRQRSPLPVVLLLAFILYAAGIENSDIDLTLFIKGCLSMTVFLFLIRLSDDICDVPIDKVTHPDRVLCADHVNFMMLNILRFAIALLLVILQLPNIAAMVFVAFTLLTFWIFFLFKPKLPTLLHVGLLNASLFIFPVYAGLLLHGKTGPAQLLMGLFFCLGGFAHDLSHSLINTDGKNISELNPINQMNQMFLAKLSLLMFIIAAVVAFALYFYSYAGLLFIILLLICLLIIIRLEINLIKSPEQKTSAPFYIMGFVFFLLPSLGHIVHVFLL